MDRREFTKVTAATAAAIAAGKLGADLIDADAPDTASRRADPTAVGHEDARAVAGSVAKHMTLRPVDQLLESERKLEGAGFPVRRPFPSRAARMFDPFVLLDEMGPLTWDPGKAVGAPAHPHRGFETVSYILQGGVKHADSLGNKGELGSGDVQWMTAGSGIVHAELPPAAMKRDGGTMHGFQLWVNLPRRLKMTKPRYQEVVGDQFPEATSADGKAKVRVIAGEALGVSARIDVHTPIIYQHWILQPGARIEQPVAADHNAGVHVFAGSGTVGSENKAVRDGQFAIFGAGDTVTMAVPDDATEPMQLLLLAGVPHNEPVVQWGPFVMNDMSEIKQAFADYRAGKMGRVAG